MQELFGVVLNCKTPHSWLRCLFSKAEPSKTYVRDAERMFLNNSLHRGRASLPLSVLMNCGRISRLCITGRTVARGKRAELKPFLIILGTSMRALFQLFSSVRTEFPKDWLFITLRQVPNAIMPDVIAIRARWIHNHLGLCKLFPFS